MASTIAKPRTTKGRQRAKVSSKKIEVEWLVRTSGTSPDIVLRDKATGKVIAVADAKWRFRGVSERTLHQKSKQTMTMLALKERMQANPVAIPAYVELLDTTAKELLMERKNPLIPAEAERVLLYDQTMARGLQVFGDQGKFQRWLQLRIPALNNQKPAELMKTAGGIQQVADELETIAHGVFA